MSDDTFIFMGMSLVVILLLVVIIFGTIENNDLRKQAIELNYAEHNRVTGKWQWITNRGTR